MFSDLKPEKLDDFIVNRDIAQRLKNFSHSSCLNTIFYGPAFSGKRILIDAFIKHLFNLDSLQKTINTYDTKINNNHVKITCIQSNYHFEINLFEYGLYDKHVLCNFVKEIASTKNISKNTYKIIVLNRLDKTSENLQLALRRIIELNYKTCRFIMTTRNLSKINNAIISRSCLIRIPLPNKIQIINYLNFWKNKKNLDFDVNKILKYTNYNLFNINSVILYGKFKYDNETRYYSKLFHKCLKVKNLNFIQNIRDYIYKTHLLNIAPNEILKDYLNYIINKKIFDNEQLIEITKQAALNEFKCIKSNKYFFCLENFFIYIYKLLNEPI